MPSANHLPYRTAVVSVFLFSYCYHLLNVHLAEFEVFLNGLTNDSIDRAISCFQEGLRSHKTLFNHHFDSRRAQIICDSILRTTKRGSIATNMVYNIPKFWINLDGLVQASNLTAVEMAVTRVFCMKGALRFHFWLLDIIPAAIKRISNPAYNPKTWIDKLVSNVRSSLMKRISATFHSSNYLPNLAFHHEYKMERKPFRFDDVDLLISVTSSIIRCWLSFPSDQQSFAQLALLEILMSKSPTSICFLDKTWEMYKTPFSTVFNNDWDTRRSKGRLIQALADFEQRFSSHPFATPGSLSYRKLQLLSQLIQEWSNLIGAGVDLEIHEETVSQFIYLR